MKVLAIALLTVCANATCKEYLQVSLSSYRMQNNADGASITLDAGKVFNAKPVSFDVSASAYSSTIEIGGFNKQWFGVGASGAAHLPVYDKTTLFIGYQVSQDYSYKFKHWLGAGVSLHFDPVKIGVTRAANGGDTVTMVTVKYRIAL